MAFVLPRIGDLAPPALMRFLTRRVRGRGFFGDYASWAGARAAASGYDDPRILARVEASALAVKEGRAAFERDGVVFDEIDHSFLVLAGLLRSAALAKGELHVLDFGGSLGGSYHQCRAFLGPLTRVRWSVVEQPHFVEVGRARHETEELRFYERAADAAAEAAPRVLLLSGVLAYLQHPSATVRDLLEIGFDTVIVDRTYLTSEGRDRLTVQKVPSDIYGVPVSYPAWLFDRDRLIAGMLESYDLVGESVEASSGADLGGGRTAVEHGLVLVRRG